MFPTGNGDGCPSGPDRIQQVSCGAQALSGGDQRLLAQPLICPPAEDRPLGAAVYVSTPSVCLWRWPWVFLFVSVMMPDEL